MKIIRPPRDNIELDHTDQESALKDLLHQVGIDHADHLPEVCIFYSIIGTVVSGRTSSLLPRYFCLYEPDFRQGHRPTYRPLNQQTDHPTNSPTTQPTDRLPKQQADHSTDRPTTQSTDQPTNQKPASASTYPPLAPPAYSLRTEKAAQTANKLTTNR